MREVRMRRFVIVGLFMLVLAGCGGKTRQQQVDEKLATIAAALDAPAVGPTVGPRATLVVINPDPPQVISTPLGPTLTPITLSDIDLAPLLAQKPQQFPDFTFDLPTTELEPLYAYNEIPLADNTLTQRFKKLPDGTGFATISLYSDGAISSDAFNRLVGSFGQSVHSLNDVGDVANHTTEPVGQTKQRSIVFGRCRAVVMVTVYADTDPAAAVAWDLAKAIDLRIQASPICPK